MLDPDKPLPKPLPCYQVWDDMLPTYGGRICTGCGKVVLDFRKFNWYQIELAQRESIVPLCGVYDLKQLDNWGKEGCNPGRRPGSALALPAALLLFTQLLPTNLLAQVKAPQHQQQAGKTQSGGQQPSSRPAVPLFKRLISGTVVTQLADSTKRPLAGVNLSVISGPNVAVAKTDSFGRYQLDVTEFYKTLHDTFEIGVAHPQYITETIKFFRSEVKPNERNVLDINMSDISIYGERVFKTQVSSTAYYSLPRETGSIKKHRHNKFKLWWRRLWRKRSK